MEVENNKVRSSNIELYRIIVMFLIICHHYVVNSGLRSAGSPMMNDPTSVPSIFYWFFGMWGKTGIDCFVLITGYFMCKSNISLKKFLKLYIEIKFYGYIIWFIFILSGRTCFSVDQCLIRLLPFSRIDNESFTNGYMAFFLFIPFLNILIRNMTKRQHQLLIGLCLLIFSVYSQLPGLGVTTNYVVWFCVLYLIASYIRFYGLPYNDNEKVWGIITIICILIAYLSVVVCLTLFNAPYVFLANTECFLSIICAVASFMFFKNLKIGYSKIINTLGACTFGIFLIHTRGKEMRQWLWRDIVDCVGHYDCNHYVLYAIGSCMVIFLICGFIEYLRQKLIEPLYMRFL